MENLTLTAHNNNPEAEKDDAVLVSKEAKISVIIPVYNQERFIGEALNSLLEQTLREWEAVCIDDGSTDASLSILNEYAASDKRIRVFHQENQGVSYTRNRGIELANGEFLFFLDPDDWIKDKDSLQSLYNTAIDNKAVICGGCIELYDERKTLIRQEKDGVLTIAPFTENKMMSYSAYQFHYGWTRFIYNREFIIKNQLKIPSYTCYEDPVFFVKAMEKAGEFYSLAKTVYCYRKGHHSNQLSFRNVVDATNGMLDILAISARNNYKKLQTVIEADVLELAPHLVTYLDKDHADNLRSNIKKMNDYLYPGHELMLVCKIYSNAHKYEEDIRNSTSWKIGSFIVRPFYKIKTALSRLFQR